MYNNINGLKTKNLSLERIIEEERPTIIGLTETKLNETDKFEINGYEVKRVDRKKEGGGVLIAFKKCLKNVVVVVREEHDAEEMLWVKIDNQKVKLRIGIIYMPQECVTTVPQIKAIYKKIEEEVQKAKSNKEKVIIMGDMNCKVGDVIKNNTSIISKGGKVLLNMCKKMGLVLVNAEECCEGTWTRTSKEKRSVLDYFIVNEEEASFIEEMVIDEDKHKTPYRVNEAGEVSYSDHSTMIMTTKVSMQGNQTEQKKKNLTEEGYAKFRSMAEEKRISSIIEEDNFSNTYTEWSKEVIKMIEACSTEKKKSKGWKVNRELLAAKKIVKTELKKTNQNGEMVRINKIRKDLINENIEKEHRRKQHQQVEKEIQRVKNEGGVNSTSFWELKRRIDGTNVECAHTIEDENGIIKEDKEEILEEYGKYYQKLLETTKGETKMQKEAEVIVKIVISAMEILAEGEEPEKIDDVDLKKIVQGLKNKKAKDLSLWKNEYIKGGGDEMENSLKKIMKYIDKTLEPPAEWEKMKIKSIHKKGLKTKMKNKRGLFITNLISKVYERIIKKRNEECFKLSPMQTGGIKNRSTIDNIMVLLAIIERNTYLNKSTYLTFADAEKCFDKLWLEDGIKDLWTSGMKTRDYMAIKRMNETAKAIIETPIGMTEEILLKNLVRQLVVHQYVGELWTT